MVLEESIYDNDIREILERERGVVSGSSLSYRGILWAPKKTYEPYLKFKGDQGEKKKKQHDCSGN